VNKVLIFNEIRTVVSIRLHFNSPPALPFDMIRSKEGGNSMIPLQSEEQLTTELATGNVILHFSATWCPDCRFIDPFMPEVEEKFKDDFTFIYVDRDQFIDVCAKFDVFGIPSFIALDNGEVVDRFVSKDRKTREEIENFLLNIKRKMKTT
jgi:thiol-disulfide isomerase/thioredoxin